MTSQINPNNINGAYPVAGQDNNSQGFRDNFTNTGTNFQYAANEISDLQQKAILNTQLIGGAVLTNQNNMLGSPLINGLISDFAAAAVPLGVVGGDVTINYQSGHYQTFTTNSAVVLGFSNFPPAGQMGIVTVQITVSNTVHTITLPTAVSVNAEGIQGYTPDTRTIAFATTGVYSFTFITSDGGSTITINETNQQLRAFNGSGELLSASGQAMSLAVTSSRFTTTTTPTPWTATLAPGVAGLTKVLIMTGDGGADMEVTVSNAGWKTSGSGTVTFTALGQSCTLRYANNHWYCTGNNGCTFT
jgi:hypothetical protein